MNAVTRGYADGLLAEAAVLRETVLESLQPDGPPFNHDAARQWHVCASELQKLGINIYNEASAATERRLRGLS